MRLNLDDKRQEDRGLAPKAPLSPISYIPCNIFPRFLPNRGIISHGKLNWTITSAIH